ncbi:MAG: nickel pincer cofactor biosynthesis protein LarC [Candidatus Omnitrophica bacterium]|nr:nickel pincer cofactor biosynthesis protein LarC [Candidatus Omnitrophota bacterium]
MKSIYFDCIGGASGDMIIASLLDCGLKLSLLKRELAKLPVSGYVLKSGTTMRGAVKARRFQAAIGRRPSLVRSARAKHLFSSVGEVYKTIEKSRLSKKVKQRSKAVFQALAGAEAQVHAQDPANVHLHEVSDLDSVIDIVGAVIGFELLEIETIFYGVIPLGTGLIQTKGGVLPLPSPATCALLKGRRVVFTNIPHELTTPTAAAIFSTLGQQRAGDFPMDITAVGYGAGTRQIEGLPNVLRAFYCGAELFSANEVTVLETNLDDMMPTHFEYVMERLFDAGALDVYLSQVIMKKNRPAVLLSVIARKGDIEALSRVIFRETTSLGVRFYDAHRKVQERNIHKVKTPFGYVSVKTALGEDRSVTNIMPEYEDCRTLARRKNQPLKMLYQEAQRAAHGEIQRSRIKR